jgi:hypothetical protein
MDDRQVSLPAIATPGSSNEPPHDDDHVRESDPEVDDSLFPLVHHPSFLWALLQELVRSTTRRFVARRGAGMDGSR